MINTRLSLFIRKCHQRRPQITLTQSSSIFSGPNTIYSPIANPGQKMHNRMFATTFKPKNTVETTSQLQKATMIKSEVKTHETKQSALPQKNKQKDIDKQEVIRVRSSSLTKQQKKNQAEKILTTYYFGETRVKSPRQFRKYVVFHDFPVIVLYKKKDDEQCKQVEIQLKQELVKSKGMFRLCVLDQDLIDKKLKDLLEFSRTPSIQMFYRASIVQEHQGLPSKSILKSFIKTVKSFHYLANEENIVSQLLQQGQDHIQDKKWMEAISAFEDVEKMERWNDIYGAQIYSSLSLAHASIGDITKAKHFMQLYRENFTGVGQKADQDAVETQLINKASQIIMSHFTVDQQRLLASDLNIDDSQQILDSNSLEMRPEDETAQILFSDHHFDTYYYSDEEEGSSIVDQQISKTQNNTERIKIAEELVNNFAYQEGLNICLHTLEADYNNIEAHRLILETFNALGFRNQVTLKTKEALKEIMLKSKV